MFVGNLDPDVDEKLLYDTFSAFGGITQTPKIMRDADTGNSKGYGFVSFDSFEASDLAIECMNAQYLCNRPIVVQYAFKKESQGERHGSQAERLLAASQPQRFKPNTIFSGGDGDTNVSLPTMSMNSMMYAPMNLPLSMMPPVPMMPPAPPTFMMPPPPPMPAGFMPPPPPQNFMMPPPPPIPGNLSYDPSGLSGGGAAHQFQFNPGNMMMPPPPPQFSSALPPNMAMMPPPPPPMPGFPPGMGATPYPQYPQ